MSLAQCVAQAFVYGDSLKNACVMVVVPEEDWVKKWAQTKGINFDLAALCENADLKKDISDAMMALAAEKKLSSLEKPKQFVLIAEPFSIENNLLTPTFKLKRNVAKNHFEAQINMMYQKVGEMEAAAASKRA